MKLSSNIHTRSCSTLRRIGNVQHPLKECSINTINSTARGPKAILRRKDATKPAVPSMKIDISTLSINQKKSVRNSASRINKSFAGGCSSTTSARCNKVTIQSKQTEIRLTRRVSPKKDKAKLNKSVAHTKSTANLTCRPSFEAMQKLLSYEAEVTKLRRENAELKLKLSTKEDELKTCTFQTQEKLRKFAACFTEVINNMDAMLTVAPISKMPAALALSPHVVVPIQTSPELPDAGSRTLSDSSLITVFDCGTDQTIVTSPKADLIIGAKIIGNNENSNNSKEVGRIATQLEEKCKDMERHKQFIRKLKSVIQTLLQENNIAKTMAYGHSSFVAF